MELFGEGLAWLANPANWTDPRNGILLRLWEHVSLSVIALALAVAIGLTGKREGTRSDPFYQ